MIPGCPSLSDEARGVLKFLWRKSHVKDNWAKGGEISDAWDRWSIFPWYMYPRYDLDVDVEQAAKIAQEIPAWLKAAPRSSTQCSSGTPSTQRGSIWSSKRASIPTAATTPTITTTRTCRPDGRGAHNAPGNYGNGLADQGASERGKAHVTLHPATLTGCRPHIQSGPDLRQWWLPYDGQGLPAQHHCSL